MSDFLYIFVALVSFFMGLRATLAYREEQGLHEFIVMIVMSVLCALALAFLIGSFDVLDNLQKSAIRTT